MSLYGATYTQTQRLLDWDVLQSQMTLRPNHLALKFKVCQANNKEPKSFSYHARNIKIELNVEIKMKSNIDAEEHTPGPVYELCLKVRYLQMFKDAIPCYNHVKLSSRSLGLSKDIIEGNDWNFIESYSFHQSWDLDVVFVLSNVPKIHAFSELFNDDMLTDFELCGEGGSVHVHKAVLAMWSSQLNKMLNSNWREINVERMDVSNTSCTTLQHLKEFIYLHKLPDSVSGLEQLLLFASKFMILELELNCADKLVNDITKDNVIELFKFAAKHKNISLISNILEFSHNEIITELRKDW